ncbi:MAG TPA: FmdB family zinc ribbon protein [Mycobacteriales bacterium]|nr:FmdB family zinc ribbon protein [Mycobacteriales bacterium]
MPTYQYACTACGDQLEAVQAFTDAPLTECPACHGRLRKVFSAVGVVFKGSGFYKTDSRAGSGANGSGKKEAAGSEAGSSGSSSGSKDGSSSSATPATSASAGSSSSGPVAKSA